MFRLTGGHQETHIKKKKKTEVIIVMCSITPLLLYELRHWCSLTPKLLSSV